MKNSKLFFIAYSYETSIFQVKPRLADPIDFEEFVSKNKVMLNNDPLRELLMYPVDDITVSSSLSLCVVWKKIKLRIYKRI